MDYLRQQVIIFGTSDYSRMLADALVDEGVDVGGFCLDEAYLTSDSFHGYSLISYESLLATHAQENISILNAIGYRNMNALRAKMHHRFLRDGFQLTSYVSPQVHVPLTQIGEANVILGDAYLGSGVELGEGNIIWPGVTLAHDIRIGDFNYFAPGVVVGGRCTFGDYNFLGLGAIVRSGVMVGNRCLIGAGAYLAEKAEDDSVCVPAHSVFLPKKSNEMGL